MKAIAVAILLAAILLAGFSLGKREAEIQALKRDAEIYRSLPAEVKILIEAARKEKAKPAPAHLTPKERMTI